MSYTKGDIKTEYHDALIKCSEMTGIPYQALLDEALANYVECDASVLVEGAVEDSGTA